MILKKIAYVIPYLYIEKSITKQNKIFSIDHEISKIRKIYRYKVINNKIYYQPMNKYIPISTYFLLEGGSKKQIIVEKDNCIVSKLNFKIIMNNSCNNNIVKKNDKNQIIITSGLLLLLKHLEYFDILKKIILDKNSRAVNIMKKNICLSNNYFFFIFRIKFFSF